MVASDFGQLQGFRNQNYFNTLANRRADAQLLDSEDANNAQQRYLEAKFAEDQQTGAERRDAAERRMALDDYFARQNLDLQRGRDVNRQDEFGQSMKLGWAQLDNQNKEKAKAKSEKLYYDLWNGINNGTVTNHDEIDNLAQDNLEPEQVTRLKRTLDETMASKGRTMADELTAQARRGPGFVLPAGTVDPKVSKSYFAQTGADLSTDPNLSESSVQNLINQQHDHWYWPGRTDTTADMSKFNNALAARQGYFNTFSRAALKDKRASGLVEPVSEGYYFRPRVSGGVRQPFAEEADVPMVQPDDTSTAEETPAASKPIVVTPETSAALRKFYPGLGATNAPPSASPATTAASIKAMYKADKISREEALRQLKALGFE